MTGVSAETSVLYDEKLSVPLRWWVQATMFLASVWLAFVVALPLGVAWAATAVMTLSVVTAFLGYGAARVRVVDGHLQAGRARIAVHHLADPTPMDPESTRRLAGRDAHAHAFLLLRPYLKRAVQVRVTDPADPTPYWLVCSRRPDVLAEAIARAAAGA